MMEMLLVYDGILRSETDAEIVATLRRKGWQDAPPQPDGGVWVDGAWIVRPPVAPPSITARQIRLWLVSHGVSLSAVERAIDAIPEATHREMVRVEWEYAPYVERSHPMLVPLAAALGMTAEQVDAAFREAAGL
jgi:hypothetical protein